jgi:hypothetical protein
MLKLAKEKGEDGAQLIIDADRYGATDADRIIRFVCSKLGADPLALCREQQGNAGGVATQERPKGEPSSTSPQGGQAGEPKNSAATPKTASATDAKPPTTPSAQSTSKPAISGSANAHETGSYFYATDPNFNKFVNISGELGWPQEPPQLLAIACELGKIGVTKSLQDIPAARWAKIAEAAEAVKLGDQPEPKAAKP